MRWTILGILGLVGCIGGTDGSGDSGTTTTTTGTTTTTKDPEPVSATISGRVWLKLYTTDASGDIVEMDWTETYGGYPLGGVFVAAYNSDELTGRETYYDQESILTPDVVNGSEYTLDVTLDEAGTVQVYASADAVAVDGVIATYEPVATWPEPLEITDAAAITDVDLTILVPYNPGGGGGCDITSIDGTITITKSWVDGNAAAMLYTTDGDGPYYTTAVTPTPITGGAEADYTLYSCQNAGEVSLYGAWDSNGNSLIDPDDDWGAYLSAPDTDGNPITVGTTALSGYDIQIPFGDIQPNFVPYVFLGGTLSSSEGFANYPGATVYVAAMKSRPNTDFSVSGLDDAAYDWAAYASEDLLADGAFSLIVPANTVTYLWAYIDEDGDGNVQEAGEALGNATGDSGKVATGSRSQTGLTIVTLDPEP